MRTGGLGILQIPEYILRFAYINLLWVCFTLLGFIIFGLSPATSAMFAVFRKWLMGDVDIPIFKTFWRLFKKDFIKSNLLGLILSLIGFALYIDHQLLQEAAGNQLNWIRYILLGITVLYLLTMLYAFPIFVHYEMSVLQVLKIAFLTMIVSPLSTLMVIAGSTIVYFLMKTLPGLIPIFGASLLSFLIMWSASIAFSNINQKKRQLNQDGGLN